MFWVFLGWLVCGYCGLWWYVELCCLLIISVLLGCLVFTVGFIRTLFASRLLFGICYFIVVYWLWMVWIGMSVGIALLIVLSSSFICCLFDFTRFELFALLVICCLCWIWIGVVMILTWWFRFGLNCFVARWLFILLRFEQCGWIALLLFLLCWLFYVV